MTTTNQSGEPPIFEVKGLVKRFEGRGNGVKALDGVDLTLRSGTSLGIVGESGAGKSTILNILLGIDRPSTGTVKYHGCGLDIGNREQMTRFRREVQVVFQDPKTSLNPRMRIGSIVAEPLRSLKIEGDHAARVAEVLAAVGLDPEVVSRYPHEFSGGQRQRIAIARAIASSPSVLLGDEPVSALDVSVRVQILDLFESLKKLLNLSLVLVSHDLAIIGRLCDEIIVLKNGRVVEAGDTRSVFTDPAAAYTQRLLDSVPSFLEN
ncbi:MAG: ABC transporter ATP-binding protein [Desulfobacteraceae bacterium]|nr:ABC transporter ATP-binding protein [Desulfobacteraceae bacterium]